MVSQLKLYARNQDELVKRHNGKIIAVKDGECLGEFNSKTEALDFMLQEHLPGTFIIIKCTPGDEEYTRRFRSRVDVLAECPA